MLAFTTSFRNSFLVLLILCALGALAQNVDSLQKELQRASSDKARAHILLALGEASYSAGNRDSAHFFISRSAGGYRSWRMSILYLWRLWTSLRYHFVIGK